MINLMGIFLKKKKKEKTWKVERNEKRIKRKE